MWAQGTKNTSNPNRSSNPSRSHVKPTTRLVGKTLPLHPQAPNSYWFLILRTCLEGRVSHRCTDYVVVSKILKDADRGP